MTATKLGLTLQLMMTSIELGHVINIMVLSSILKT